MVYIAKAPTSAQLFNGEGEVWTKIWEQGLVSVSRARWASDLVNDFDGLYFLHLIYVCVILMWFLAR